VTTTSLAAAVAHRLAAGGRHGGTVVTSIRQLVSGIAPLHPSWKLTGDPWQDRDRQRDSSVRAALISVRAARSGQGVCAVS